MATLQTPQPPHIAMLPPPGFLGHLIPFIELSKKLVSHHNCTITIIIPHDNSYMTAQKALLQHLPTTIDTIFLPPVPSDDLPTNANPEMLLPIRIIRSLPAVRDTLSTLSGNYSPVTALVVDLFASYAIDIAKELRIPAYIFYVVAATGLSLAMDLPKLDESCTAGTEYSDLPEPIKLPGSAVLSPEDLPDTMKERRSEVHKWAVDLCKKYLLADGIIVNSFFDLESEAFQGLIARPGIPPVYPVGPLISKTQADSNELLALQKCLRWLDEQPPKSVLYVSFGSGGTLSMEQIQELAFGLEMSRNRFLWVVRMPQENASSAYLNARNDDKDDPLEFLPEGFLERTKGRGFVVAKWAPQIDVLRHMTTGGFLTHCGWNSILESVVFGVPLIAWPLCFEQKMNAVFVTDVVKGAIRVRGNAENGVVGRQTVLEIVKRLIEGEEGVQIRNRMIELRDAAGKALGEDGSSSRALDELVQKWTNNIQSSP